MRFHNDDSVRAAEAFRQGDPPALADIIGGLEFLAAFYPAHIIYGEKIGGSEALLAPQNVLS
jgi:hypothetical protein